PPGWAGPARRGGLPVAAGPPRRPWQLPSQPSPARTACRAGVLLPPWVSPASSRALALGGRIGWLAGHPLLDNLASLIRGGEQRGIHAAATPPPGQPPADATAHQDHQHQPDQRPRYGLCRPRGAGSAGGAGGAGGIRLAVGRESNVV